MEWIIPTKNAIGGLFSPEHPVKCGLRRVVSGLLAASLSKNRLRAIAGKQNQAQTARFSIDKLGFKNRRAQADNLSTKKGESHEFQTQKPSYHCRY